MKHISVFRLALKFEAKIADMKWVSVPITAGSCPVWAGLLNDLNHPLLCKLDTNRNDREVFTDTNLGQEF